MDHLFVWTRKSALFATLKVDTQNKKVLCSSNTSVWNYKPYCSGRFWFSCIWVWFLSTWNIMQSDVVICLRKVLGSEENRLDFSCTDFTASCISTFFFFSLFFTFVDFSLPALGLWKLWRLKHASSLFIYPRKAQIAKTSNVFRVVPPGTLETLLLTYPAHMTGCLYLIHILQVENMLGTVIQHLWKALKTNCQGQGLAHLFQSTPCVVKARALGLVSIHPFSIA